MKNSHRKLIALLEIIGGIIGIGVILFFIPSLLIPYFQSSDIVLFKIVTGVIFLYALSVYFLSTFSGIMLWKKHKKAILLSLISQFVQIPTFFVPGIAYTLISCLGLFIKIGLSSVFFNAYLGSKFSIFLLTQGTTQTGGYYVGLNIVALVIFIFLYKHRRETL